MLHEIDCLTLANDEHITYKEKMEEVWIRVKKHTDKLKNPKSILSERAAYEYEGSDYGKDLDWCLNLKRCERGYYSPFYVCSNLKGFCFLITHDDGVDLIDFINYDKAFS